ncbi:Uncharacterized protein TCM_008625 [Theobroma cacao]|uniref:Uncharacterized protein n=1 Tax=Theobroma cacao TaxID=3641 RepID=A0A061E570_THECC|nr:Uncharacterized protein TCM_008625 [Theobroma cacao]
MIYQTKLKNRKKKKKIEGEKKQKLMEIYVRIVSLLRNCLPNRRERNPCEKTKQNTRSQTLQNYAIQTIVSQTQKGKIEAKESYKNKRKKFQPRDWTVHNLGGSASVFLWELFASGSGIFKSFFRPQFKRTRKVKGGRRKPDDR